jgi:hypothetical protein
MNTSPQSVDWEAVARREGWTKEPFIFGGFILFHRNLDRLWQPADDWEGAARNLGIGDDGRYPDESAAA